LAPCGEAGAKGQHDGSACHRQQRSYARQLRLLLAQPDAEDEAEDGQAHGERF
jgi:hypothetical protein